MLEIAVTFGYGAFTLALLMTFWRLLTGPTSPERILALDTLYVNVLGLLVLLGIDSADGGRSAYFEAALLIALMGFVGTVAAARFLARGDVIE